METKYRIELNRNDLGQLLEGLEIRTESWERTFHYLLCGQFPKRGVFIAEECHKPEEAAAIAQHYRSIIADIRSQRKLQE